MINHDVKTCKFSTICLIYKPNASESFFFHTHCNYYTSLLVNRSTISIQKSILKRYGYSEIVEFPYTKCNTQITIILSED